MRIKLTLSYISTNFHGFQRQKNQITIQGVLEDAIYKLTDETVTLVASGRTDNGVHAIAQVAHFDLQKDIGVDKIVSGLNHYLSFDIRISEAKIVERDFNARYMAKRKTYFYDMYFASFDLAALNNRAYRLNSNFSFNVDDMKSAAKLFIGQKDFVAFKANGSSQATTMRTVFDCGICDIELYGQKGLRLYITADGFLYKMARIIAGAIINVGAGKMTLKYIENLLSGEKEVGDKFAAPAYGLYLYNVQY